MFPPNDQFPALPGGPSAGDPFSDLPLLEDEDLPVAEKDDRNDQVFAAGLEFFTKMRDANRKEP
jgi:hypothetical protein